MLTSMKYGLISILVSTISGAVTALLATKELEASVKEEFEEREKEKSEETEAAD